LLIGHSIEVTHPTEVHAARRLLSETWVPTERYHIKRIVPERVTGGGSANVPDIGTLFVCVHSVLGGDLVRRGVVPATRRGATGRPGQPLTRQAAYVVC